MPLSGKQSDYVYVLSERRFVFRAKFKQVKPHPGGNFGKSGDSPFERPPTHFFGGPAMSDNRGFMMIRP